MRARGARRAVPSHNVRQIAVATPQIDFDNGSSFAQRRYSTERARIKKICRDRGRRRTGMRFGGSASDRSSFHPKHHCLRRFCDKSKPVVSVGSRRKFGRSAATGATTTQRGSGRDQGFEERTRRGPKASRPRRTASAARRATARGAQCGCHAAAGQSSRPLRRSTRHRIGRRNPRRAAAGAGSANLLGARHDQGQPFGASGQGPCFTATTARATPSATSTTSSPRPASAWSEKAG